MAKKTLLKVLQLVSEAISGDEIDTIGETDEAFDIMNIIETTYDEILDRQEWEFLKDRTLRLKTRDVTDTKLFNLGIPSDVTALQVVKYRADSGKFPTMKYMEPISFLEMLDGRNPADSNVTAIANDDGVLLNIITDKPPTFYTSFDEENLSFDSFDSARGTGAIPGDSVIVANIKPVMDFTDPTAKFPIPERMHTLLINEAIATAAVRLRQTQDPRAERISSRQHIRLKQLESITGKDLKVKRHGRRTRSGR